MKSPRLRLMSGFTLVELMVSLGIFGILSAILIANYPETSMRLYLASLNQSMSLLVREAQVRGSAIDSRGNATDSSVNSAIGGYGIFVTRDAPNKIILFADSVDAAIPKPYGIPIGNGLFESTAPFNETDTVVTFPPRYTVSKVCVGTQFPFICNDSDTPPIRSLVVSFTRPNPMPDIYINNISTTKYSAACIEIRSTRAPKAGHIRTVQIFNSGMIKTSAGKCDNNP